MKYEHYKSGNGSSAIQRRDPDEIERDVREIRAEMSETLRRIEDRLSPKQLLHQVTGGARVFGEGSATMAKNLGSAVRDNPVPLLLIGAGIASLMVSQRRDSESATTEGETHRVVSSLRSKGGAVRERAAHVRDKVSDAGHRAREVAHDARVRGQTIVEEQPLVLVGLGLAAGALLAAFLPMTEKEHRTVGRARDRIVDRGKEVARGAREGFEGRGNVDETWRADTSPAVAVQPSFPVRDSFPPEY